LGRDEAFVNMFIKAGQKPSKIAYALEGGEKSQKMGLRNNCLDVPIAHE